MTYAEFLLTFLIIPTAILLGFARLNGKTRGRPPRFARHHWTGLAILALIAFAWTTPWDNFLIARGVWDSPPDRILGRVGFVPLEEYAFFLLMPALNGTFFFLFPGNSSENSSSFASHHAAPHSQPQLRIVAGIIAAALFCGGLFALASPAGTYLGLILVWFVPPLFIQWIFDPRTLMRSRKTVALATLVPTAYFGLADSFAIGNGIWEISATMTTGVMIFNLPLEELLFFMTTSLLLAQGLVLWHSLQPKCREK